MRKPKQIKLPKVKRPKIPQGISIWPGPIAILREGNKFTFDIETDISAW